MRTINAEAVLNGFLGEYETWQAEHPGHTRADVMNAFSPHALWLRAGGSIEDPSSCDGTLYCRLLHIVGALEPRRPGDDGNLPCGWPGRRRATAGG